MNDIHTKIAHIKKGLTREQLLEFLGDANQYVRGTALYSLVDRFGGDDIVVNVLETFIDRMENRRPVSGGPSLSHAAMKLLMTIKKPAAEEKFAKLRQTWPQEDRADLEWFLENG